MSQNEKGGYEFKVKLTRAEWNYLVKMQEGITEGKVVVATVRLGPGWRRGCPGRKGVRCVGDGVQPIELRNMGEDEPGSKPKLKFEVCDQPYCQKCR